MSVVCVDVYFQVAAEDKKKKRKLNRRFIVVEGIYFNFGDLVDLAKVCITPQLAHTLLFSLLVAPFIA
jgi:7-keto-8-aminopelargonate synthetase-like enzyme